MQFCYNFLQQFPAVEIILFYTIKKQKYSNLQFSLLRAGGMKQLLLCSKTACTAGDMLSRTASIC